MNKQLIDLLKTIVASSSVVAVPILIYLKFFLNWFDSRVERKKKNIEVLDKIIDYLPNELSEEKESILKLCAVEKFNAYFKTRFDFETIISCLKTDNPSETIKIVKMYRGNIDIIDGKIIPKRAFDDSNKLWKLIFIIYFIFAFLVGISGVLNPEIFSRQRELTIVEEVFIRLSFSFLLVFLINELYKFNNSKKYINNIS